MCVPPSAVTISAVVHHLPCDRIRRQRMRARPVGKEDVSQQVRRVILWGASAAHRKVARCRVGARCLSVFEWNLFSSANRCTPYIGYSGQQARHLVCLSPSTDSADDWHRGSETDSSLEVVLADVCGMRRMQRWLPQRATAARTLSLSLPHSQSVSTCAYGSHPSIHLAASALTVLTLAFARPEPCQPESAV